MLRSLWVVLLLSIGTQVVADEHVRTVTVTGTGFAEVAPDRATLQMSIVAREKTVDAAQHIAADATKKVLEMTDRLQIGVWASPACPTTTTWSW